MYHPASMTTGSSGLTHLASVYYERAGLKPLRQTFNFWKGVENRLLPKKNGKTIQFYRYSQLGANTTATSEGTVGTPIEMADSTTISATVAQYSDFISLSDMLVDTAIDPDIVAQMSDQLGYRAGASANRIVRAEVDSVAASIDLAPLGDYFSAADLLNIRTRFAGQFIKELGGGFYPVLAHSYVLYDFRNDPSVGGFLDVAKQGVVSHDAITRMNSHGLIARMNGCEVYEANDVAVVSGSPNKYRVYAFGEEGLAAIDLAGRGPTRTPDQDKMKFRVTTRQESSPSGWNPEGKIRAWASYNFVFVAKVLDSNPYRIRKIDVESSLGI